MCGIVAQFAYAYDAPRVSRAEVLAVRDAMASRGPDGAGYWESADGRVALGHRRLSVIDLSVAAAQPFAASGGDVQIVFNGEIYNHRELRAGLAARGHVFRGGSDTEVLLALYRESGIGMVEALRGMYAFAIWDERDRTLFAARDPLGIKPLYVADDGRTLRLASQVRALVAGGGVDTAPDPAGHVGFFVWGCVPEPFTLHRGISAVPAGARIRVRLGGGVDTRRRDVVARAFARTTGAGLSRAALGRALRESVRSHLVADVPVGLFLSAGRDSTSIGALAVEEGWTPRTLTLGFDELHGTPLDEVPLAESMARTLGARHTTARTGRPEFEESLDRLFAAMDQPSTDGVNTWLVSSAARRQGWKVVLSGLGGDELFGGYPSFSDVPRSAAVLRAFSEWPEAGRIARRLLTPIARRFVSPKYASLFEYGGSLASAYLLRRALYLPWELEEILDGDALREGWDRLATIERLEESIRGIASPHAAVAALEAGWYMRNQLLRDADWAGMGHSLEIRVPLVDRTLFERVAPEISGNDPPTKRDLAGSPRLALPAAILHRKKTGFATPVEDWIRRSSEPEGRGLRSWAAEVHRAVGGRGADAVLRRRAVHAAPGWGKRTPSAAFPCLRPAGAERVLVSTIFSPDGGVSEMVRFVTRSLAARGYEPVLAYYMPYSLAPRLSVPSFRMLQRRVTSRRTVTADGFEAHEIGAFAPELEFTNYGINDEWRRVIGSCRHHMAVSGNFLASYPLAQSGVAYLSWLATPWMADRRDRVSLYSPARRVLDLSVVRPVTSRLERRTLRNERGRVIALSEYTKDQLDERAGVKVVRAILPMPVDIEVFRRRPEGPEPFTIMFAGRLSDPRKNIGLYLQVLDGLRRKGHPARGILAGGRLPESGPAAALGKRLDDANVLEVYERTSRREYAALLQRSDVFFVPSHQEGLCIAALEAMACGCPVVSTRCGGPEEFVKDGETGFLTGLGAEEAMERIGQIASDRHLRDALGERAQNVVATRYSRSQTELAFSNEFARALAPLRDAGGATSALARNAS